MKNVSVNLILISNRVYVFYSPSQLKYFQKRKKKSSCVSLDHRKPP